MKPDAAPLSKVTVQVAPGKSVDGTQMVTIITTDTRTGKAVAEEQLVLARKVRSAPAVQKLPEGYAVGGGRLFCKQGDQTIMTTTRQGTLLYRVSAASPWSRSRPKVK